MDKLSAWEVDSCGELVLNHTLFCHPRLIPIIVENTNDNNELIPLVILGIQRFNKIGMIWVVKPISLPMTSNQLQALSIFGLKEKDKRLFAGKWISYVFEWQLPLN